MKKLIGFVFLILFSTCLPLRAQEPLDGRERILSFESDITVNVDSTLSVTETIVVLAGGDEIKHGIYRDFPTRYNDAHGNTYNVDFSVVSVFRDNKPEKYHLQKKFNGIRVYCGDSDILLKHGQYTYTLRYNTGRQLGFFKDFDELYWNVTGNGWVFPIVRARATIALPSGAIDRLLRFGAFTGPKGSTQKNFSSFINAPYDITFTTTQRLGAREGLTIYLDWPKGIVKEPTGEMKAKYFLKDNAGVVAGIAGLLLIFIYYCVVWNNVGRDPVKSTVIPLYTPPDKLSPAAMRFITRMDFDNKILSAAIINMAVKGNLAIEESGGVYTLLKLDSANPSALAEEEKLVFRTLLGPSGKVVLAPAHQTIIAAALKNLRIQLQNKYERIYFFTNREYFIPGLILSIIAIVVSSGLQAADRAPIALFMSFWLSIWTFGVVTLLIQTGNAWRMFAQSKKMPSAGSALFLTLFSIPFVCGEIIGLGVLIMATSISMLPILLVIVGVNFLFYYLLRAPTYLGRKIMDKIEGFRMYLSTAEKERLNIMNPAGKTPELFEKYLPYSLALDVEQAWAEQFSDVLEKAGIAQHGYSPSWFRGAA